MSYITPAQLADAPRAQEIAQAATPESQSIVPTDLMDAVLRDADTSAWTTQQVAVANSVLATVNDFIIEAGNLIDGFIGKRYELPLTNPSPLLTVWARSIVRYKINQNLISDEKTNPIARDYRDALNMLQLIGAGKFSLGAGDLTGPSGLGLAQISTPGRTFDSNSLNAFTAPLDDYLDAP